MSTGSVVAAVRSQQPLVHCISAAVSMGIVADGLLAAGARPMMTETVSEAPVVTTVADALLVNLGTLSTDGVEGIPATVAAAQARGVPWVLDPAAVGVAPVRTALARELLAQRPAVVRGNASEVLVLAGQGSGGRGADSAAVSTDALDAARQVALASGAVVAVSGTVDLLIAPPTGPGSPGAARGAGTRLARVERGSLLLTRVTGTGCLLGALTAACTAVTDDLFLAALTATCWIGLAGEVAASRTRRPGSYRTCLLDALDEVAETWPDDLAGVEVGDIGSDQGCQAAQRSGRPDGEERGR
ncbi:MAG: hydroxyethylthiazole kinase [Actinomycetia bacterium]|nr:hydroxyethylthiazole kinase [Actinomycetes bacterium]